MARVQFDFALYYAPAPSADPEGVLSHCYGGKSQEGIEEVCFGWAVFAFLD